VPFEYLDHQADLGIRGTGSSPEEAMSEAAQAMLSAMADTSLVREVQVFAQRCTAQDVPALFVEWLNELLYQRQVAGVLFARAWVTRLAPGGEGWSLEGTAWGEPLDPLRHELHTEVKAATYYGLDYRMENGRYAIQCVLDV
jgi:SHS2 domain-containing protein